MSRDTIFAPATPPGKSGVAIMRLSGPQSRQALALLTGKQDWQPNQLLPVTLKSPATGNSIDQGMAVFFEGPKSFTGEDAAELHVHGSLAVMLELLDTLVALDGFRPAEPGEFSRRAYGNGKMDLIEAEGLADLIAAETPAQKAQALRQLQGNFSQFYDDLRNRIIRALAHLEAYIDFPDEEIPASVLATLSAEQVEIISIIEAALADGRRGERLRDGIRVVILGAPNVGKSSLLNAIAGREAAIVSQRAGTTRDVIEVHMDIGGFPVILTDTAGLRDSTDEIEEEGVRRARERAEGADIRIVMFDGTQLPRMDSESQALVNDNTLIIINKIDNLPAGKKFPFPFKQLPLMVSVKSGNGIDNILNNLYKMISLQGSSDTAPVITRMRHRTLLNEALASLKRFSTQAPLELACEELRRAGQAVGKITGKIQVDDVLDVVFREFCIGK